MVVDFGALACARMMCSFPMSATCFVLICYLVFEKLILEIVRIVRVCANVDNNTPVCVRIRTYTTMRLVEMGKYSPFAVAIAVAVAVLLLLLLVMYGLWWLFYRGLNNQREIDSF